MTKRNRKLARRARAINRRRAWDWLTGAALVGLAVAALYVSAVALPDIFKSKPGWLFVATKGVLYVGTFYALRYGAAGLGRAWHGRRH